MGSYASGDIRKIVHSSEDDEGYENQSFYSTMSVGELNQSGIENRSYFPFRKSAEISLELVPLVQPASDDSDKPFWAENELSSSESKHQLIKKQKRRHSLSYRNRIARHRGRSAIFQSSSSSLDSVSGHISSRVLKQERRNHCTSRFAVEKLQPGCSITKKKLAHNKVTSFLLNDQNIYSRCKNPVREYTGKRNSFLVNKKVRQKNCSQSSSGYSAQNRFDAMFKSN